MKTLDFHFNVPDKTHYAARLLRKIYRAPARAVVMGEPTFLEELDRILWCEPPTDFVPHCLVQAQFPDAQILALTPLLLIACDVELPPSLVQTHPVLLILARSVPSQIDLDWTRCIDVVSQEEDDRILGRERWQAYVRRGWSITKHEFKA